MKQYSGIIHNQTPQDIDWLAYVLKCVKRARALKSQGLQPPEFTPYSAEQLHGGRERKEPVEAAGA